MASAKNAIVGSLVGSCAFAAALGGYLYHAIPSREELLAESGMTPAASAGFAYAEGLDTRVKTSVRTFIAALHTGDDAGAYTLMAAPYKSAATPAAFSRAWHSSPFLVDSASVTIYTVRETVAPGATHGALSASGVITSGAGAVPIRFTFLEESARIMVLSVVVADAPVLVASPR